MMMTYYLRECEEQTPFCETLAGALPDEAIVVRQLRREGRNMASLSVIWNGDVYSLVTDTLRASVPWDYWTAVDHHWLNRAAAEAVEPRPLFSRS